jgi:hypothetical protein
MYPGRFEYFAPESVGEAVSLLAERGGDAKVLAGGQSLIPLMKLRFASPGALVDVNRIDAFHGIEQQSRAAVVLAALREGGVSEDELVRVRSPAGLDLGPCTQEEIAVAVPAELIAWRHSRAPRAAPPEEAVCSEHCRSAFVEARAT